MDGVWLGGGALAKCAFPHFDVGMMCASERIFMCPIITEWKLRISKEMLCDCMCVCVCVDEYKSMIDIQPP